MADVRYFKGVWQVRNGGYTVEQFQNEDDARTFASKCGDFPLMVADLNVSNVGRTAYLIKRL